MAGSLNELKRHVFYELLDLAGRVFIIVKYAEDVVIGNRGFTEEEKKNGLVLVFNRNMSFSWGSSGITATLVFGSASQKCFIPLEHIAVIYSPELNSQFVSAPAPEHTMPLKKDTGEEDRTGGKIVKVDFQRKKPGERKNGHES